MKARIFRSRSAFFPGWVYSCGDASCCLSRAGSFGLRPTWREALTACRKHHEAMHPAEQSAPQEVPC